jgi:hypothetical protein
MNDYIKAGVELADGWGLDDDPDDGLYMYLQVIAASGNKYNVFGCPVSDPYQPSLDALAAQLVRQVDALDRGYVQTFPQRVVVGQPPASAHERFGDDRTMNTIKAIVDSGVLT